MALWHMISEVFHDTPAMESEVGIASVVVCMDVVINSLVHELFRIVHSHPYLAILLLFFVMLDYKSYLFYSF